MNHAPTTKAGMTGLPSTGDYPQGRHWESTLVTAKDWERIVCALPSAPAEGQVAEGPNKCSQTCHEAVIARNPNKKDERNHMCAAKK